MDDGGERGKLRRDSGSEFVAIACPQRLVETPIGKLGPFALPGYVSENIVRGALQLDSTVMGAVNVATAVIYATDVMRMPRFQPV